jgi:hypothetical protein
MNTEDIQVLAELIVSKLEERLLSPTHPFHIERLATLIAQKVMDLSGEFNQEDLVEMAKKVQQSLEPDVSIANLDE